MAKIQVKVRPATADDILTLGQLGHLLWPHHSVESLMAEFTDIMHKGDSQFFLADLAHVDVEGKSESVGFAQCQLHYKYDFLTGTCGKPQGFLEGIFVKESYRRQGVATDLFKACEQWAKEQGCKDFGSDCNAENEASRKFHAKQGFKEAEQIVIFHKNLD